jgi:iron complex outermembrane receptor protein
MPDCHSKPHRGGASARAWLLLAMATASALSLAPPARAQERGAQLQEVIVTARKREETLLSVPVVAQAITGATLARLQTPQDIASLVPSLEIGEAVLSSGTRVFLRGVGTTSGDPGVDQSVSLNVDGLQLTNGLAFRSGLFDLGRIEVLKGPQGLFYGKNSPGGVISLYSADPTNKPEVSAAAGYETEARTKQVDLILSGPVSETLKLRLATRFSDTDGFFKNPATALAGTGALTPTSGRLGETRSVIVRGTALWNPTSKFDARLKANYVRDRELWAGQEQFVSCPDGTGAPPGRLPYMGGGEDCHQDTTALLVGMDPAAFPGNAALGVAPLPYNGSPSRVTRQTYGTLEMNYRPMTGLTVTSLTALYKLRTRGDLNSGNTTYAGPPIVSQQAYDRRDFTEELRANSDFSGPLNFTAGAFFQDARLYNLSTQRGNITQGVPALRGLGDHHLGIQTYSLYGQIRWQVMPKLELDAGARWSVETRKDKARNLITGTPVPVLLAQPRIHSNNVKPEITATYRPTDTLTLFASYRTGYKSGSLNISTGASTGQNNSYGDENVKGWEAGVKSRLMDRRLAVNLAVYDYHYRGLQVTTLVPAANLLPVARTLNAGSARTYGVEFDGAYNPPQVERLSLHAALNWNHARFQRLDAVPCWGGQTIAEGCNELLNPTTGLYTGQNLDGTPLIDAPNWSGSFGFDYDFALDNGMSLTLSNNNHFSSRYITTLGRRADFYQGGFIKADLSLTLKGKNDRWELALIGRDLNNEVTRSTCASTNIAGGLIFGGEITGGTARGPAGIDEVICYIDRGRELWVNLTVKPFN